MDPVILIVYIGIFFLIAYFLMIRPNRKRAAEQQEMTSKMTPGTRVMLTTGMFGTVRAMGDKQAVVELAPGVDVTVLKPAIARVLRDNEEEFEFADPDAAIDPDAAPVLEPTAEKSIYASPASPAVEPQSTAAATPQSTPSAAPQGAPATAPQGEPISFAPPAADAQPEPAAGQDFEDDHSALNTSSDQFWTDLEHREHQSGNGSDSAPRA